MQLPLVVGIQQRFGDPLQFISEDKSRLVAEGKALNEYIDRKAYMAVVLEIDKFLTVNTEQIIEVFKITRTCKCVALQRFFKYKEGSSVLRCILCHIQYGIEESINESARIEQDTEVSNLEGGEEARETVEAISTGEGQA